jgi:putative flavoprotein involved in K+ transport
MGPRLSEAFGLHVGDVVDLGDIGMLAVQGQRGTIDTHDRTVTFEDGDKLEVETLIWATGFRTDYSWIHVPVLDEHGVPCHRRGLTDSPGFFFLGMKNQYSRGSSLINWVRDDADFIVDHIRAERVGSAQSSLGI